MDDATRPILQFPTLPAATLTLGDTHFDVFAEVRDAAGDILPLPAGTVITLSLIPASARPRRGSTASQSR